MVRGVLALLCTVLVVGCGGRSENPPEPEGRATNSTTGSPSPEFPCGDPSRWGEGDVWCWPMGRDPLLPSAPGTEWELDAHGCGPADAYDWASVPECGGEPRCDVATPDLKGPGTCCFRYEIACKV